MNVKEILGDVAFKVIYGIAKLGNYTFEDRKKIKEKIYAMTHTDKKVVERQLTQELKLPGNSLTKTSKPGKLPVRTLEQMINHGAKTKKEVEAILSKSGEGSYLITDIPDSPEKCISSIDKDGMITHVQKDNADCKDFIKNNSAYSRPVFANADLLKTKETVNIIYYDAINLKTSTQEKIDIYARIKNEIKEFKKDKLVEGGARAFEVNGVVFFIRRGVDPNNEKAFEIMKKTDLIGGGNFSKVYALKGIGNDQNQVYKQANYIYEAWEEVKNEVKMLNELHGQGVIEGLQAAPYCLVNFNDSENMNQLGYLNVRYDGDCFNLCDRSDLSSELKIITDNPIACNNIINALQKVHQKEVYLGDIKPDNILFLNDEIVLSDLGGARKFEDIKREFVINIMSLNYNAPVEGLVASLFGTGTNSYISYILFKEIIDKVEGFSDELQKEILKGTPEEISKKRIEEKFQEQIVPLMKKNDECALGLSLYSLYASELPPLLCYADSESLAGQNEYENREDISQVINTMKEKLKDTNAPPEIIEMIEAGLKK